MPATARGQSLPSPITSNNYAIELYQGPVLAPIHVMGVAGAYVASAEGTEGGANNSAAPAVRDPFSTSWFDYDLGVGISFPGAFASLRSAASTLLPRYL